MSRIGQAALGLVVVQATAHSLVMRLTRMPGHEPYLASTAVVLMELIKLVVCTLVVLGTVSFSPAPGALRRVGAVGWVIRCAV
jgi:hypothetical protein